MSSGNLLAYSLPAGQNQLHPVPTTPAPECPVMPHAHADRNLLFGILALQMDFISRDALIAAMHAWVLEKAKPLGQILQSRGGPARDERVLLDAMVAKHLQKHGEDAGRSLASLVQLTGLAPELH